MDLFMASTSSIFVQNFFAEYGYLALFLIFILEGAMLLYFAPSESLVPIAVIFLADSPIEYAFVIGVAVFGATIGQYALFTVAKKIGREKLLQKKWFRVKKSHLERFDGWFYRWGAIVIPISNTMFFTRGMLTVPAGLSKMGDKKFIVLSAVGTLIFETLLALAALKFWPFIVDIVTLW
tara:strand:+ start:18453 stop:18989 length:537 start_codon:yes stop_codon:yes gene_type:complete